MAAFVAKQMLGSKMSAVKGKRRVSCVRERVCVRACALFFSVAACGRGRRVKRANDGARRQLRRDGPGSIRPGREHRHRAGRRRAKGRTLAARRRDYFRPKVARRSLLTGAEFHYGRPPSNEWAERTRKVRRTVQSKFLLRRAARQPPILLSISKKKQQQIAVIEGNA